VSNTCFNTVKFSGPRPSLERFAADLAPALDHDFLRVHVPVAKGVPETEAWGTRGVKGRVSMSLDADGMQACFDTHWSPPHLWFERVARMFPSFTLQLYCGSIEGAYGGYLRAAGGEVQIMDLCKRDFARFFEERGWPGYFVPYWEDPDFEWPAGRPAPPHAQDAQAIIAGSVAHGELAPF